jgi:hypothetical protein
LDFALSCNYITAKEHAEMSAVNQEVGKMLGSMIANPQKSLLTPDPCPLTPVMKVTRHEERVLST